MKKINLALITTALFSTMALADTERVNASNKDSVEIRIRGTVEKHCSITQSGRDEAIIGGAPVTFQVGSNSGGKLDVTVGKTTVPDLENGDIQVELSNSRGSWKPSITIPSTNGVQNERIQFRAKFADKTSLKSGDYLGTTEIELTCN